MDVLPSMPASSSRILYDVPCAVCRDNSSGKHYGVFACDGCAGFFKRSVRRDRRYACKGRSPGTCLVDKAHRNQCRACRYAKCLNVGMNKDAVQHERGPRNSTIRRQMAMLFKDPIPTTEIEPPTPSILDLALPKQTILPPPAMSLYNNPYSFNRIKFPTLSLLPLDIRCSTLLNPPLLTPSEPEAICESAAKILFMNVKWAKNMPTFTALSLSDRLILLEQSWRDLFILGTSQFLYPVNLKVLYANNPRLTTSEVEIFERVLNELMRLRPDNNEFACLRGIVLFKTSISEYGDTSPAQIDYRRLQDLPAIAAVQDHSQIILHEYISRVYPLEISRASHLLYQLQIIRTVSPRIIVELFFRSTIGETPIEKIISDMYRSEKEIMLL